MAKYNVISNSKLEISTITLASEGLSDTLFNVGCRIALPYVSIAEALEFVRFDSRGYDIYTTDEFTSECLKDESELEPRTTGVSKFQPWDKWDVATPIY